MLRRGSSEVLKYFAVFFKTTVPALLAIQFEPNFSSFRLRLFPGLSWSHARPLVTNEGQPGEGISFGGKSDLVTEFVTAVAVGDGCSNTVELSASS